MHIRDLDEVIRLAKHLRRLEHARGCIAADPPARWVASAQYAGVEFKLTAELTKIALDEQIHSTRGSLTLLGVELDDVEG